MIIIIDDTFTVRHKFHDIEYLNENKYNKVCTVYSTIRTTELGDFVRNKLDGCELFCNHKTLQLYDSNKSPLNLNDNTKYREKIINEVEKKNIPRIEFSRGIETDIDLNKIDKDLFYTNLKAFLDYYITNNLIELKILFFGQDFDKIERLSTIQNMLVQIRLLDIDNYSNNDVIKKGIEILYPSNSIEEIIAGWKRLSKNELIKEVNNLLNRK